MKNGWLAVAAACVLVYANGLDNSFHYDDEHSIEDNIHLRDLGNIPAYFVDPSLFSVDAQKAMYRPLLLVSYALNYTAGGFEVRGYRLVNILLHAINACLVWCLARLFFGADRPALVAGLLFALHPLGSEPVNYISSRSESLAACFYLLSLVLFVRYTASGRWGWLGGSQAALALGLLCKAVLITLPLVVLLYDFLFFSRRRWERLRRGAAIRHLPYWLLAAGYLGLISANGFLPRSLADPVRGVGVQFLTQIKAVVYYLYLLVSPVRLNVEHQFFDQEAWAEPQLLVPLLLVGAGLGLLVLIYRRGWNRVFFFLAWGAIALVPTAAIPLNVLVNEHRLYLSCAAFALLAALVFQRLNPRRQWALAAAGGLAAIYGLLAAERTQVWADAFTLWGDAVAKAPQMERAHLYLGNAHSQAALAAQGRADAQRAHQHWQGAVAAYRQVIALNKKPELSLRALNNLGSVQFSLQNYQAADKAYRRVIELDPRHGDALVNLGNIHLINARQQQDPQSRKDLLEQAVDFYRRALEVRPNQYQAHSNRGLALVDLGRFQEAEKAYRQALFLNPNDTKVQVNLAKLYLQLAELANKKGGEANPYLEGARPLLRQALGRQPHFAQARRAWAHLQRLSRGGR